MSKKASPVTRRKFLKTGALAAGAATAGTIAMPQVSRAQTATLKMQSLVAGQGHLQRDGAATTSSASTTWPAAG